MGSDEAAIENHPRSSGHTLPKVGSWYHPLSLDLCIHLRGFESRPSVPLPCCWPSLKPPALSLAVCEGSPDYSVDIAEEVPASGRVACPVPFSPCQA